MYVNFENDFEVKFKINKWIKAESNLEKCNKIHEKYLLSIS